MPFQDEYDRPRISHVVRNSSGSRLAIYRGGVHVALVVSPSHPYMSGSHKPSSPPSSSHSSWGDVSTVHPDTSGSTKAFQFDLDSSISTVTVAALVLTSLPLRRCLRDSNPRICTRAVPRLLALHPTSWVCTSATLWFLRVIILCLVPSWSFHQPFAVPRVASSTMAPSTVGDSASIVAPAGAPSHIKCDYRIGGGVSWLGTPSVALSSLGSPFGCCVIAGGSAPVVEDFLGFRSTNSHYSPHES